MKMIWLTALTMYTCPCILFPTRALELFLFLFLRRRNQVACTCFQTSCFVSAAKDSTVIFYLAYGITNTKKKRLTAAAALLPGDSNGMLLLSQAACESVAFKTTN